MPGLHTTVKRMSSFAEHSSLGELGVIRLEFVVAPVDVYCRMTIQSYRAHLQ